MELKPREKKCSFHLQISFNEAEHKHVKNRKEKNGFIKSPAKRQPILHCSLYPLASSSHVRCKATNMRIWVTGFLRIVKLRTLNMIQLVKINFKRLKSYCR